MRPLGPRSNALERGALPRRRSSRKIHQNDVALANCVVYSLGTRQLSPNRMFWLMASNMTDPQIQGSNFKTTHAHWEAVNSRRPTFGLPSSLVVSTRDLKHLLRKHIEPQMKVLEIGFAPGKFLAFAAKVLEANVSGIDYSEGGVQFAKRLFGALGIGGDLRCEDVFTTTLPLGKFDFVYSNGLIEHFEDPTELVRRHVEFLRPGGTALILIPNYGGIYGRIQRHFDPENLEIHNLNIMNCGAMSRLSPGNMIAQATSFRTGKISPWLISFDKTWPRSTATLAKLVLNGIGLLQPFDIGVLCPMIALKLKRK